MAVCTLLPEKSAAFLRRHALILAMTLLAVCFFPVAQFAIACLTDTESDRILYTLHMRANSLAASIEGAARFMGRDERDLSGFLREIGRQPGIAWLALTSPDGRIILDSNPELVGSLLYSPAELTALQPEQDLQGRLNPDDPDVYETWKLFSPGRLFTHGHHRRAPDNGIIFVALNASWVQRALDDYRDRLWFVAIIGLAALLAILALIHFARRYLVSHRKMQDAEAMAEQVIQSYPGALLATTGTGKISFRNRQAQEMFPEDQDRPDLNDWGGLDWKGILRALAEQGQIQEKEALLSRESGEALPVRLTATKIHDGSGNEAGYLIIVCDLQEISLLQRRLAQSQRLSAIGRLASGLAHEIRNPLSSICGYACYLEQKLASDPLATATARLLVEESHRLNRVLTDLLYLAREPLLQKSMQPLSSLLRKLFLLALPDAQSKGVDLALEAPEEQTANASFDAERLLQALLNVTINAIQATPPGGHVRIGLERLAACSGLPTGCACWQIQIKDNGKGMSEKVLAQLFTPYFTTRPEGTGLGLAIARQIIEAHNGTIEARSLPGRGATFLICLPAEG